MIKASVIVVAMALASAAGCNGGAGAPASAMEIDAIDLYVGAAPVNVNDQPGPDGLEVRVHCYRFSSRNEPQAVTVAGTLEFLMYEGRVAAADLGKTEPYHTWSFASDQLAGYVVRPLGLWGYGMTLLWGDKAPRGKTATLVARYRAAGAEAVLSRPIPISLTPR